MTKPNELWFLLMVSLLLSNCGYREWEEYDCYNGCSNTDTRTTETTPIPGSTGRDGRDGRDRTDGAPGRGSVASMPSEREVTETQNSQCSVIDSPEGVVIACTDGTLAILKDGSIGPQGVAGEGCTAEYINGIQKCGVAIACANGVFEIPGPKYGKRQCGYTEEDTE